MEVILDTDLAGFYEMVTGDLNRTVKRKEDEFPQDCVFQLTPEELMVLKYQMGMLNPEWGGPRYRPYAFTQMAIDILSEIFESEYVVQLSPHISRAFAFSSIY